MPVKRPQLANGEVYHVVIRGVEGRKLFIDEGDYYRCVHDLYEFNDNAPTGWEFRYSYLKGAGSGAQLVKIEQNRERDRLVDVLSFCVMPNHAHLFLRQIQDGGITKFMRKLGAGYAGYFNKKYDRKGVLFQGRFKAVHIKTDEQSKIAFVYIHTNPVAIINPNWKELGIKNPAKTINFVETYKWSSYGDYIGRKNFPSVIQKGLFSAMMSPGDWQKFVNSWIEHKTSIAFGGVDLE